MSDPTATGPSLRLLWRLTAIPAVLLALAVVLSIAFLLPWGPTLTDDRLGALWVLLASLIATVATLIGALLTAGSEQQARQLERDREARQAAADADAARNHELETARLADERKATATQQRLDSTIQGIKILEAGPDNRIMAAGAFAMVVRLGEPEVALRMLGPALEQGDVDAGTAAWVIDQGLTAPHLADPVRGYAARLLMLHAAQFPSDDFAGAFDWPPSLDGSWPADLDENTGAVLVLALADLLTSRPRSWWTREGGGWGWVLVTLYLALRDDPHELVKCSAAWTLRLLHDPDDPELADHWLGSADVQAEIAAWGDVGLPESRQRRLSEWVRGDDVALPTRAESASELAASTTEPAGTGGAASSDTSTPGAS